MWLTKRYTCFLVANAALIFINFSVWVYDPRTKYDYTGNEFPGNAYDPYEENHVIQTARSDEGRDESESVDLAPKRIINPKRVSRSKKTHVQSDDIVRIWREKYHNYSIGHPETDLYVTPHNVIDFKENHVKTRRDYQVPSIEYTNLVNCAKLLSNDKTELKRAQQVMVSRPKVPIYEETYQEWFKDCKNFRRMRGYVEVPLTKAEEDFPMAYSIAMFTDVELTERLLRAIYRPNSFYCIHVDTKSSMLVHQTIRALANCFDNVWIASHLDKIKWGDVSVLLPEINCMRDMVKYHRKKKWKYFINLTGQEIPLRTNYEISRIAQIFNGSNDIAGSISRMETARVKYHWTHRWSKTYQQTIFYNTLMPKEPPPFNITFFKGELHGLFSKKMVEYIVESEVAQKYLEWCWDTGHPSEHYWNTLNYNKHLAAPGGYEGPLDLADKYSDHPVIRAKDWLGLYDNRTCHGKVVRGICVYGVEDAPWLAGRPELFANKFHLTFQYIGYDCLEELHRNRTILKENVPFDENFYRNLPVVKYSRKNGL